MHVQGWKYALDGELWIVWEFNTIAIINLLSAIQAPMRPAIRCARLKVSIGSRSKSIVNRSERDVRSLKWPMALVLSLFLVILGQLFQDQTLDITEGSFANLTSLMLDEPLVRPKIAHSLFGLRDKLGSCYRAIAIQLDALNICV